MISRAAVCRRPLLVRYASDTASAAECVAMTNWFCVDHPTPNCYNTTARLGDPARLAGCPVLRWSVRAIWSTLTTDCPSLTSSTHMLTVSFSFAHHETQHSHTLTNTNGKTSANKSAILLDSLVPFNSHSGNYILFCDEIVSTNIETSWVATKTKY